MFLFKPFKQVKANITVKYLHYNMFLFKQIKKQFIEAQKKFTLQYVSI